MVSARREHKVEGEGKKKSGHEWWAEQQPAVDVVLFVMLQGSRPHGALLSLIKCHCAVARDTQFEEVETIFVPHNDELVRNL